MCDDGQKYHTVGGMGNSIYLLFLIGFKKATLLLVWTLKNSMVKERQ